jgi:DNA polymerase I
MNVQAFQRSGYQLLHEGVIALAEVEANGIRIDVDRLETVREELNERIVTMDRDIKQSEVWDDWKHRFGQSANLSSRDQLSEMVYEVLKFPVLDYTDRGAPSVDDEALQKMDHPFLADYREIETLRKLLKTFINGIASEVVNGRLHPSFDLHRARTMRSSSSSPNFQNLPVRNKESSAVIRSLFTASPGCVLVENDFKGIEVTVSAAYHKDKNFISYITTPGKDMHRDMAAQIYLMDPKEVSKDSRYGAKNKFVFPQFYGDFYVSCARSLWDWIEKGKLTGPGDVPLKEHLAENGIEELGACDPEQEPAKGTFEHHLQKVENDFWNNRFQQYGRWRRDWYKLYLSRGYFDILSGFRISGFMRRNAVINYPVQGAAFHCLLQTLIWVNAEIKKRRMKTKLVGQIHDSLIADVPESELWDYLDIVHHAVVNRLRAHWKWINVPLEIETELCAPGKTWFDKQEVKFDFKTGELADKNGKIINDLRAWGR